MNDIFVLPLTNQYQTRQVCIVDIELAPILRKYNWNLNLKSGYINRFNSDTLRTEPISRFIVSLLPTLFKDLKSLPDIDHKDGNSFYNKYSNLRLSTTSQNCQNRRKPKYCSSKYKGVSFDSRIKKWAVYIGLGKISSMGKRQSTRLGYFNTEIEAARAYDAAAIKYFGEFARINFPSQEQQSAI